MRKSLKESLSFSKEYMLYLFENNSSFISNPIFFLENTGEKDG